MTLDDVLKKNPWVEMAERVCNLPKQEGMSHRFVLGCDNDTISAAEASLRGLQKLRLDIPPQPFIGHPSAKIWIIQYNPGYSEYIDEYNYLGIDRVPFQYRHKLKGVGTFAKRADLIGRQYVFGSSNNFYAIDESFDILTSGFRNNGHMICGMYLWYMRHLFPKENRIFAIDGNDAGALKTFADKNLFVIERFPYHSYGFTDDIPFASLPSFKFWQLLMEYALSTDKIIIVYGNRSATQMELKKISGYAKAVREGRILDVLSSGRGLPSLNLDSVLYDDSLSKAIPDVLRCGGRTLQGRLLVSAQPAYNKNHRQHRYADLMAD